MFSRKEWRYIEHFKSLSRDDYGRMWEASNHINGFLIHLPWWAKDNKLEQTCQLYQVDSKGQLFLLCIMHVRKIKTSIDSISIIYTTDARHARLECYRVPKWRWGRVGLMSISPFGDAHVLTTMPGQLPLHPDVSRPVSSVPSIASDEKTRDTR